MEDPSRKRKLEDEEDSIQESSKFKSAEEFPVLVSKEDKLLALQQDKFPTSLLYRKSYVHKANVSFTQYSTRLQFLISICEDGSVRMWRQYGDDVELAKTFAAHNGVVVGACQSANEDVLATLGVDGLQNIYNVMAVDMTHSVKLNVEGVSSVSFVPGRVDSLFIGNGTGSLAVVGLDGVVESSANIHSAKVHIIKNHSVLPISVSVDQKGHIEVWMNSKLTSAYFASAHSKQYVDYASKLKTNLIDILKAKCIILDLLLDSMDGMYLHVVCEKAAAVRIFGIETTWEGSHISLVLKHQLKTGARVWVCVVDEAYTQYGLNTSSIERTKAVSRDKIILSTDEKALKSTLCFAGSGYDFIAMGCAQGIAIVQCKTGVVTGLFGLADHTDRFTSVCQLHHHVIAASCYKRNKLCLFNQSEPTSDNRDVQVERTLITTHKEASKYATAATCVLFTTLGELHLKLFPHEAPKAVHNFITLAKEGYYDGCLVHRVIKGFMLQSGDAELGTGVGGQSCWKQPFEDELSFRTFDKPGVLAMANKGPCTNGSQFFITFAPQPHLNNKHTIFGMLVRGRDALTTIENTPTNKRNDRPLEQITITSIEFQG